VTSQKSSDNNDDDDTDGNDDVTCVSRWTETGVRSITVDARRSVKTRVI